MGVYIFFIVEVIAQNINHKLIMIRIDNQQSAIVSTRKAAKRPLCPDQENWRGRRVCSPSLRVCN